MDKIINEIKSKIDLIEYVGKILPLKKSGSNFKTNCCFHEDKTPSLILFPHSQRYFCFSEGIGGDIISWIMAYDKLSFHDAIIKLAGITGINISNINSKEYEEKEILYKVLTAACDYYVGELNKNEGIKNKFLKDRKISEESIYKYKIGFAPYNNKVFEYLKELGFTEEQILLTGMFIKDGDSIICLFKNRLMFPIIHNSKNTFFLGRNLEEQDSKNNDVKWKCLKKNDETSPYVSKYINTRKLFNEDIISCSNEVFLCESILDAISGNQNSFPFICKGGTSLTENELERLYKLIDGKKLFITFDRDENKSGINGALNIARLFFEKYKKIVNIVLFPNDGLDKMDVCRYFQVYTNDDFKKLIDNSNDYISYLINNVDISNNNSIRDVLKLMILLPPLEQDIYINKLSEHTGKGKKLLKDELFELEKTDKSEQYLLRNDIMKTLERKVCFLYSDGASISCLNKKDNSIQFVSAPKSEQLLKINPDDRESLINKYPSLFKNANSILKQKQIIETLVEDLFVEKSETLPTNIPIGEDGLNNINKKYYFCFKDKVFLFDEDGKWKEVDTEILNLANNEYNLDYGDLNDVYQSSPTELYKKIYSLTRFWRFKHQYVSRHLLTSFIMYSPYWKMFSFPLILHILGHTHSGKSKMSVFMSNLMFNADRISPDWSHAGLVDYIKGRPKVIFMDETADEASNKDSAFYKKTSQLLVDIRSNFDGESGRLRSSKNHKIRNDKFYNVYVFSSINAYPGNANTNRIIAINTLFRGVKGYNPLIKAGNMIKDINQFKIYIAIGLMPYLPEIKKNYDDLRYNVKLSGENRTDEIYSTLLSIMKLCVPDEFDKVVDEMKKYMAEGIKNIDSFSIPENLYDCIMNTPNKSLTEKITIEDFWNDGNVFSKEHEVFDKGSGVIKIKDKLYIQIGVLAKYAYPRFQEYSPSQIHNYLKQVEYCSELSIVIRGARYYEIYRRNLEEG